MKTALKHGPIYMPGYACSKCGNMLPVPPPDATGWTCDAIIKGRYCNGLPTRVR